MQWKRFAKLYRNKSHRVESLLNIILKKPLEKWLFFWLNKENIFKTANGFTLVCSVQRTAKFRVVHDMFKVFAILINLNVVNIEN